MSNNNLAKIELHAKRLEAIADKMDQDGVGGHPTRGHAAILRQMASSMRADAARGKTPHTYEPSGMFASASDGNAAPAPKGRPVLTAAELVAAKGPDIVPRLNKIKHQARRLGY